jgi:hypothetical protein
MDDQEMKHARIVISVPKSGTYFIAEIIKQAHGGEIPTRFFTAGFADGSVEKTISKVKQDIRRKRWEVAVFQCHWEYHPELLDFIKEQEWKPVFIYRNPFDVAVSFVDGAVAKKFRDPIADRIQRTADVRKQYMTYIKGLTRLKHPNGVGLERIYDLRMPWKDHIPTFRYEDLIGPERGGNEYTPEIIDKLVELLEVDADAVGVAIEKAKNATTNTKLKAVAWEWNRRVPISLVPVLVRELDTLNTKLGYDKRTR